MKKVSYGVKKLLIELFKSSDGLEAYTLFKRSGQTFNDFTKSFNQAMNNDLLYIYDESTQKILLTDHGSTFVLQTSRNDKDQLPWRKVPSDMVIASITPNEPYIPNLYLLDKDFSLQ